MRHATRSLRPSALPLSLLALAAAPAAQVPLYPAAEYDTGRESVGITSADVDGDGRDEVIAVTPRYSASNPARISTWHGDRFGNLGSPTHLSITGNPRTVAFGDLNGDGLPDVVTADEGQNGFRVYASNGSGGYAGPTTVNTTGETRCLAVGDADGDGLADVVSGTLSPRGYALASGDGAGGFTSTANVSDAGGLIWAVGIRDLDGDTVPDLALVEWAGVTPYLGDGLGGHVAGTLLPTNSMSSGVDFGDLDEDGHVDMAVVGGANANPRELEVAFGDGMGGFEPFVLLGLEAGGGTSFVVVDDLDGDGHLDVAAAGDGLHVAYGDGQGGFTLDEHLVRAQQYSTLTGPILAIGDLDGDGDRDTVTSYSFHLCVLLQRDDGTYFEPVAGEIENSVPGYLRYADFDGDGRPDALAPEFEQGVGVNQVRVHLGDGAGGFQAVPGANPVPLGSLRTLVADFDGDGSPDAGVLTARGELSVLLGDGAGGLGPAASQAPLLGVDALELEADVADIDMDGDLDVVAAGHYVEMQNDVGARAVWLGAGNGTLGPPVISPADPHTDRAMLADLNVDGVPELLLPRTQAVDVHAADLAGDFLPTPATTIALAASFNTALVSDLTGDGNPDFATLSGAGPFGNLMRIYAGDGAGSFGGAIAIGTQADTALGGQLLAADVDGDGHLDLITGGRVRLGKGGGAFGSPMVFHERGLQDVLDVDGDGRVDLVQLGGGVLFAEPTLPAGIQTYGEGTPGCRGAQGLTAREVPSCGNADFAVSATNASPLVPGLMVISSGADVPGTVGLDVLFHVQLVGQTLLFTEILKTDDRGTARVALPIPEDPFLVGFVAYAQGLWLWLDTATCDPSAMNVSSSRGIAIQIQP